MTVGVVAVGNRFAGDDAVGPLVLDALREAGLPAGVVAVERDGEPARILDAWDGLDAVVVVDAARSGAPVGTVHRVDPDDEPGALAGARAAGTHGAGVAEALALGAVLGRRPPRVVLVAVEGEAFAGGAAVTAAVAAAVPVAVGTVLHEVARLGEATARCA